METESVFTCKIKLFFKDMIIKHYKLRYVGTLRLDAAVWTPLFRRRRFDARHLDPSSLNIGCFDAAVWTPGVWTPAVSRPNGLLPNG